MCRPTPHPQHRTRHHCSAVRYLGTRGPLECPSLCDDHRVGPRFLSPLLRGGGDLWAHESISSVHLPKKGRLLLITYLLKVGFGWARRPLTPANSLLESESSGAGEELRVLWLLVRACLGITTLPSRAARAGKPSTVKMYLNLE